LREDETHAYFSSRDGRGAIVEALRLLERRSFVETSLKTFVETIEQAYEALSL
jgi:hypothetical protein